MAGDPRIRALVAEQQHRPEALIEVLHRLQAQDGYLSKESLRQVAQELGLPLGRVYGVASFYHLFHLEPPRPHRCAVCLGQRAVCGATAGACCLRQHAVVGPQRAA
jgi:NADH:ubiquinone oxidoreductase subunit E